MPLKDTANLERLKRFKAEAGVQIPDTTHSQVAIGSRVDLGSTGGSTVDDIYLREGRVYVTLKPHVPGQPYRTFFFMSSGVGEPLEGDELAKHLKRLEEEEKARTGKKASAA